jgi:hypothetical protein
MIVEIEGGLATEGGSRRPLAGNILVANFTNDGVTVYAPTATGTAVPSLVPGGP